MNTHNIGFGKETMNSEYLHSFLSGTLVPVLSDVLCDDS